MNEKRKYNFFNTAVYTMEENTLHLKEFYDNLPYIEAQIKYSELKKKYLEKSIIGVVGIDFEENKKIRFIHSNDGLSLSDLPNVNAFVGKYVTEDILREQLILDNLNSTEDLTIGDLIKLKFGDNLSKGIDNDTIEDDLTIKKNSKKEVISVSETKVEAEIEVEAETEAEGETEAETAIIKENPEVKSETHTLVERVIPTSIENKEVIPTQQVSQEISIKTMMEKLLNKHISETKLEEITEGFEMLASLLDKKVDYLNEMILLYDKEINGFIHDYEDIVSMDLAPDEEELAIINVGKNIMNSTTVRRKYKVEYTSAINLQSQVQNLNIAKFIKKESIKKQKPKPIGSPNNKVYTFTYSNENERKIVHYKISSVFSTIVESAPGEFKCYNKCYTTINKNKIDKLIEEQENGTIGKSPFLTENKRLNSAYEIVYGDKVPTLLGSSVIIKNIPSTDNGAENKNSMISTLGKKYENSFYNQEENSYYFENRLR